MFKRFDLFEFDPHELLWKNLLSPSTHFTSILNEKLNYPVNVMTTDTGLRMELAIVGAEIDELDITVDGNSIRIKYESPDKGDKHYLYKGIVQRSFDLSFKIATKFDISKLSANMDKGLLSLDIPNAKESEPKKIEIKKIK